MILKKIEIFGFKSFGTKTEINLSENITAIVGPNGSGKSNIVDAVKWVIGEQRTKTLRSEKMQEVIFSGNDEKKALGYAQVTLTMNNSNGIFPIEYDEVSVTRRLFRSGESEYYINKSMCRLKDVQELFMDTGLGREGYSIIRQGQIESLVESSAYERRLMIEEAVGIVKYKTRKTEAERRLERAQNNLYRITDIIAEIESRLPSLKKQSEKAEKYVEYKNQLKDIEVSIFVSRMDKLSVEIEKYTQNKDAVQESLTQINESLKIYDQKYQKLKSEVGEYDAKITEINNNLHTLITNYENSKTEIALAKSKTQDCLDRILLLNDKMKESDERIANYNISYENAKNELDKIKISYDEINNKYNEHLKYKNAAFDINDFMLREDLHDNQKELKNKFNKAISETRKIEKEYEENKRLVNELFTSIQVSQTQLAMLKGYEESMQGYHFGVKKLSELKNRDVILQNGLYGAVGELISSSKEYSEAITKALGSSIEYMLTDNESTATHCINLLKENKWGRVTFLPKNIIKRTEVFRNNNVRNLKGFIGMADELVSCDKDYVDIASYLMGRVIIADNLENAKNIAKMSDYRYRIVTLDGDVIFSGGAMTGGKVKNGDDGAIVRKAKIEALDNKIITDQKKYTKELEKSSALIKLLQESRDNEQKIKDIIQNTTQQEMLSKINEVNEVEKELILTKEKASRIADRVSNEYEKLENEKLVKEETQKNIDLLQIDITNYQQKIEYLTNIDKDYDFMHNELEEAFKSVSKKKDISNKDYIESNDKIIELNNERNIVNEKLSKIEINLSKAQFEADRLQEDMMQDYSLTYASALSYKTGDVKNLDQYIIQVEQLRSKISKLGNINVDALEEYKELKNRFDSMTTQRDDLVNAKEELNKIIGDMSKSMQKQFNEQFILIKEEFSKVFKKLFPNGSANLILTDPLDTLNTGIEIVAKTNTNRLNGTSALSGGEKTMTSIALIFAILNVKPAPFCILDEIDAALDDANVTMLCEYLLTMSKQNQLILITHKKRSMQIADSLYGMSMGNEGITKVLSVKFSEITKEVYDER